MKLLAWAILIFAVLWVLRSKSKAKSRQTQDEVSSPSVDEPASGAEVMVSCTHCGVHFPVSEAVYAEGRVQAFCSTAHRQQHLER